MSKYLEKQTKEIWDKVFIPWFSSNCESKDRKTCYNVLSDKIDDFYNMFIPAIIWYIGQRKLESESESLFFAEPIKMEDLGFMYIGQEKDISSEFFSSLEKAMSFDSYLFFREMDEFKPYMKRGRIIKEKIDPATYFDGVDNDGWLKMKAYFPPVSGDKDIETKIVSQKVHAFTNHKNGKTYECMTVRSGDRKKHKIYEPYSIVGQCLAASRKSKIKQMAKKYLNMDSSFVGEECQIKYGAIAF